MMSFLLGGVAVLLIVAFFIIKNARGSVDRGKAPDISDPSSAPDSIGDKGNDGDGDSAGD